MTDLIVRSATPSDMPSIARLCWAYRDLLIERSPKMPPKVEAYFAKDAYASLVADLPDIHARPRGDILIATRDKQVLGCAMYYPISDDTCEMKRVYVDAAARGLGVGQALMRLGIKRARADGYKRMVLDTLAVLTDAVRLYERIGFTSCAPFYELDPEFSHFLRFYDIQL